MPGKAVGRRWRIASNGSTTVVGSGDAGVLQPVRPQIWVSSDPAVWVRVDVDPAIHGTVSAISATTAGFTAFVFDEGARDSMILTSPDGRAWVLAGRLPRAATAGGIVGGVVRTSRYALAVGGSADGQFAAWASIDGTAWTASARRSPAPDGAGQAVATIPSGYVAVGTSGGRATAWTSGDGSTWPPGSVDRGSSTQSSMMAVAVAPDGSLLGVGAGDEAGGSAAWDSPDGSRWTPVAGVPADDAWFAVLPTAAGWLILGRRNGIATAWQTDDGHDWTPLEVPGGVAAFDDAILVNGRLVAVGPGAYPNVYSSFVIVEGSP